MGIDIKRFVGHSHEPFICNGCKNVLEDPVMTSCGHIVCVSCLNNNHCPECGVRVNGIKNCGHGWMLIHKSLPMKCRLPYCEEVITLDDHKNHDAACGRRLSTSPPCCFGATAGLSSGHDCEKYLADEFMAMQMDVGSNYEEYEAYLDSITEYKCLKPDSNRPAIICDKCAKKGDQNENEISTNFSPLAKSRKAEEVYCDDCWELV